MALPLPVASGCSGAARPELKTRWGLALSAGTRPHRCRCRTPSDLPRSHRHGPFRGPIRRCADLRVRAYAYVLGAGIKPVCAVVRVRARGKPIWGSGGRRFKSCLPDHFFNLGSTSSAPTARRWSHSRSAPRAASIRSAARRRFSSKTSVYVLSVIRTSECPTISMSAQGESPCAWRSEAAVCRSSLMPRAGQAPDDI